ncbi:MAG: hypothetical protein PUB39_05905 [Eubacteriales bacterium]|nr:hypothetical protein [Eubacteriales bacterium]
MRVVYNFHNDEAMRRALAEIKADEKSVARTRMILRILIIICVGVLYYNGYKLIANGIIDGYSIFAIVFGTAALIYAIMLKRVQVWMILRNVKRMDKDYLNGYGTWTFSDEGIATDSTLGKGETPWSSVEK